MKRAAKARSRNGRKAKQGVAYDVVALVASAGGHAALETVLRALPPDFPVPLVVMQHLSHDVAEPLRPFARRLPFSVQWAHADASLARGRVLVAPPRTFLEILPDGTCAISPCERGALARPIDRFLGSLARSFAHRAIGVVLSGMLDDGAEGARALRAAGGAVLAQTGAEYASMPDAVVRSGGADMALPAEQIADLLGELATGAAMPRPMSELEAVERLFAGDSGACAAMRGVAWEATPLGPVLAWPQALSTAVRNAMSSTLPTCIYWGPELVQIYNEAFLPIFGAKPSPAGKPARLTWPELWSTVGSRLESVLRTGSPMFAEDQLFQAERHGYPEELYLTYSLSALHDSNGTVCGVLGTLIDATARVRASRRLKVLRDLGAIESGESPLLVAEQAAKVLGDAPLDVPFALLYLFDQGRMRANLAACAGLDAGMAAAPHTLMLQDAKAVWPLADVKQAGSPCTVDDLASRLPGAHTGPWPEPPSSATLLPLWSIAGEGIAGAIVLGHSPRLRFDPTYGDFLRVVAQQVSASIAEAEARQRARARADRLAELDRVKVEFFSNVSHEFRTPLTLLLAPLEETLRRRDELPSDLAGAVEAAARNGRRLLALVNTLLDFSQAESHRGQARLEPTDLAALTIDIASPFRSAIETAGLRFEVRCDRGMPEVWVDRHMWEKIVSNLLSNAFKFTFEGEITVELKALSLHAELVVKDTGVGVPAHEIPNLFKRFHRVRGTRARTAEGSGIGLSMVHDFVTRMSGQVRVTSKEGVGTRFTIWIPLKSPRVRAEPLPAEDGFRPTEFASQVAREASRWSVDSDPAAGAPGGVLEDVLGPPHAPRVPGKDSPAGRVLVVDDNADMRAYLARLLSPRWRVELAADSARAFDAAVELLPDLILADVMMPGLDGFELLKKVRAHPGLRHTPVVLVTARAGEEAAIEGLLAGADDYIAKPFSARELIARVGGQLELARARRRTAELNELLVRFSDAVRGLVDPHEVARTALRMVAEHFGAEEAYLAEVDWTTREYLIEDVYLRAGGADVPSLVGRRSLDAWEPRTAHYLANRPMVTDDAQLDDRLSDELKAGFAARQIRAHISVPVTVEGQLRAVLGVNPGSPRRWTPEDVALVEGVAGRCWSEIERARAEAELRARNDELERFHNVTVGRELRMVELKNQVNALRERLGEPPHDPLAFDSRPESGRMQSSDEPMDLAHLGLAWERHRAADELDARPADLKQASAEVRDARRATLNVLEDAVEARDLAEKLYRELRERETWLRGPREALEAALNGASLETSLGVLVRTVTDGLGEDARAAFYLANGAGTSLHHVVGMSAAYAEAVDGFQIGSESLACSLATHTGQPIVTSDVTQDPLWKPWVWLAERFDYRGCWSFPILTAGGKFIGSLAVYWRQPREATKRNLELASLVTDTASIIIARHQEWEARARAEQALRESEARMRALVEMSSDVVYRMGPDWTEMRVLHGRTTLADTVSPTRSWLQTYILPEDRPMVLAAIQRAIDERCVFELEHRVLRSDGSVGWIFSRAVPIVDEHGEIAEWFGAAFDVTERHQRQERLA